MVYLLELLLVGKSEKENSSVEGIDGQIDGWIDG